MVGGPIVVRAAISVRKFGRGGRAFAPHFRSATRPRHRGLRPDRPLLCGESSARRSGNPGRRAGLSAANRGRPPRFATETSIDHRDFQPQTAVGRPKLRSITAISVANRGLPTKATSSADAQRVAMSKSKASKAVSEAEISAQDRALLNAFLNAKVEKRPTPLKQPGKRWPRVTSP